MYILFCYIIHLVHLSVTHRSVFLSSSFHPVLTPLHSALQFPLKKKQKNTLKLKAIDRPQEPEKVPRAPHDRKKEWQKLALGAELAQDAQDDKHREANGSAAYHDNRCVRHTRTHTLVISHGEMLNSAQQ